MKKEIVPYTVSNLHSTIDYMKLIELQANAKTMDEQEKGKVKTYCNPILNCQNQRYNKNRESNGINPKNK